MSEPVRSPNGEPRHFWFDRFLGGTSFSLPQRMLSAACFSTLLLVCLALVVNLSIHMPLMLVGFNLLVIVVYVVLYLQSRLQSNTGSIALAYAYLSLGFLFCFWFPSGGITGSIPLLYAGLLAIGTAIIPRKHVFPFVTIMSLILLLLFAVEWYYPQQVMAYTNLGQQKLDIFFTLLVAMVMIGGCLLVFCEVREEEEQIVSNALEYKSRFLSHMSHELRTPLNIVLGFTRVLQQNRQEQLSEKELDYLQRIQSSGLHMLSLVNDLLDLSRLESQQMQIVKEPLDLEPLLVQVFQSFEVQAQSQQQDLRYHPSHSTLPHIYTDPHRLRQILVNLLGNAIKYTPEGGQITLRVRRGFELIWIEVADTGPGIALEQQAAIFRPFYQLDPTSQTGAGLGLAITAQLCQLLGFSLTLKSKLGAGSRFMVGIPV